MTTIAFGPFEPDVASIGTSKTSYVKNVFPRADGYGPVQSLAAFTDPLTSRCMGVFGGVDENGGSVVFAGTLTGLYRFDATSKGWENVSKLGGYSLDKGDMWSFVQFGSRVVAVTGSHAPQVYDLASSTQFSDLGGSPPRARGAAIVGDFLVLYGLTDTPRRIHWSGLNDVEWWTPGSHNCDWQDFPDGGAVRSMAGGEFGIVFQDTAIRRMVFAPGSDIIFQFQRISEDRGILMPYSTAKAHSVTFFLSQDGFYKTDLSGQLAPIGANRVDHTLLMDADMLEAIDMVACADPSSKRVVWAYRSNANKGTDYLDKLLIYDWALDRWSQAEMQVQILAPIVPPAPTVESLDALGGIDSLVASFDSYVSTPAPSFAAVASDRSIGFFTGDTLEATIDTPEGSIGDGVRTFVQSVTPIGDSLKAYVAIESRERIQDARRFDRETEVSRRSGASPQRSSGRYQTARVRFPAKSDWTFARGVEVEATQDGKL